MHRQRRYVQGIALGDFLKQFNFPNLDLMGLHYLKSSDGDFNHPAFVQKLYCLHLSIEQLCMLLDQLCSFMTLMY